MVNLDQLKSKASDEQLEDWFVNTDNNIGIITGGIAYKKQDLDEIAGYSGLLKLLTYDYTEDEAKEKLKKVKEIIDQKFGTNKDNNHENLKKNKIILDDEDTISTQNQLLSIALKVGYIEEENKATQRAVALLKQRFDEFITYKKDEQARNRERRF